jgi:hypothetical protein
LFALFFLWLTIVTYDGLILTCYHVIEDKKNNTIHKAVHISFPSASDIKEHANLLEKHYDSELDIAFLQLQEKLPDGFTVADLGEIVSPTHSFIGFGFRKAHEFNGLHSDGKIMGTTDKKLKDGSTSTLLIQLESKKIAPGMSGSPILDNKINRVIGIVSERYRTKNPGLVKFNNFLGAIGKSGSFIHYRFEDVYVPSNEYEEIEKILKEFRCVFITGSPEYGKTFTAIKLLWEFYKNSNYMPRYIEEGSKETNEIITKLVNQDKSLENSVIYIEDPVGKTEYRSDKQFEGSIGSIISGLGHLNANLIITMREPFKEFLSIND